MAKFRPSAPEDRMVVARDWWGRGLATEAPREALRDALERVGLERVIAVAMPTNLASRRVGYAISSRPAAPHDR